MTAEGSRSPIHTNLTLPFPAQVVLTLYSPLFLSRTSLLSSLTRVSRLSRASLSSLSSSSALPSFTPCLSLYLCLDVCRFQISAFVGVADHAIILTIVLSATTFTSYGGWSVKPPRK